MTISKACNSVVSNIYPPVSKKVIKNHPVANRIRSVVHSGVRLFPEKKDAVSPSIRVKLLHIKQRNFEAGLIEKNSIEDILSLCPRNAAGSSLTFEDPWKGRSNVTRKKLTIDDYQKLAESLMLKDAYPSFKFISEDPFKNILRQICIYICIRLEHMGEPEECQALKILEYGSIIANNFRDLPKANQKKIQGLLSDPSRVADTVEEERALELLGMFEHDNKHKLREGI